MKSQKFRKSQLALKNEILSFSQFETHSFILKHRMITIRFELESPDLRTAFK